VFLDILKFSSVFDSPLLYSSHFRAYSTVFNRGKLHLYHITGFYIMSINFKIAQLRYNEATVRAKINLDNI
jgi:hypothetical protein